MKRLATIFALFLITCPTFALDIVLQAGRNTGEKLQTAKIQKAIDKVSLSGGGIVTLKGGKFLTAPLEIKSGVNLCIDEGATLLGSPNLSDYQDRLYTRHFDTQALPRWRNVALIYADEAENIAISGKGTIDCNGSNFVKAKTGDNWTGWWYDRTVSVKESIPRVVFFAGCRGVSVSGVTMVNQPAGWSYWVHDCDNVSFEGCKILADVHYPNNDGIHINCSRDVSVRGCEIETGDDAIVLRANSRSLKENKPCERTVVTDCKLRSWSSAVRIGWTGDGVIRNCFLTDLDMCDCSNGVSCYLPDYEIVESSNDYGREATLVENIRFSNIRMDKIYGSPIFVKVGRSPKTEFEAFKNVTFDNVVCHSLEKPFFNDRSGGGKDVKFSGCKFFIDKVSDYPENVKRHGYVGKAKDKYHEPYHVCAFVWPSCHDDSLGRTNWEQGIGEWEVIKQGNPRFEGHYQPKEPLWGYEMDNDPAVVEKWINTALAHGVNTFVYDWYWFDHYPYLESALNDGFLKAPSNEKMEFFIMWANHNVKHNYWNPHKWGKDDSLLWTGVIDPADWPIIVKRVISQYFSRPNYTKIDGKPVFAIFSAGLFIESFGSVEAARKALDYMNDEVVKAGFPGMHFMMMSGSGSNPDKKHLDRIDRDIKLSPDSWAWYNMGGFDCDYVKHNENASAMRAAWDEKLDIPVFPTVSIGWDDTPRFPAKGAADVTRFNQSPEVFEKYLRQAKDYADSHARQQPRFIFINAWNEWVEGSYLLPDKRYGYGYLEAVQRVFAPENVKAKRYEFDPQVYLSADRLRCNSNMHHYEALDTSVTAAPSGFKAFYFSNINRHGSRGYDKDVNYSYVDTLRRYDSMGLLTAEGQQYLKILADIKARNFKEGRGALTTLGAKELAAIGRRAAEHYPEIFSNPQRPNVSCYYTTVPRVGKSMENFVSSVSSLYPSLKIHKTNSKESAHAWDELKVKRYTNEQEANLAKVHQTPFKDSLMRTIDSTRLLKKIFVSGKMPSWYKKPAMVFFYNLFSAGCCRQCYESDTLGWTEDYFTDEELLLFSKWRDARQSFTWGWTTENKGYRAHNASVILENIIKDADAVIAGADTCATLRFSHDTDVLPLMFLIGVKGADWRGSYKHFSEHSHLSYLIHMAGNLQFVFYKNAEGEVIVKILLNEEETTIPALEPDYKGLFYKWDRLKGLLVDRCYT